MQAALPPELTASPMAYAAAQRRTHAHQRVPRERFAPLWLRASLIVATVVTLALLYPKPFIESSLRQQSRPSTTTLAYLRLMVLAQPAAREPRVLLAQQALAAGDLQLSQEALAPWRRQSITALPQDLALLRLRLSAFELGMTPPASGRHASLAALYIRDAQLLAPHIEPSGLLPIARLIASLGEYQSATRLYRIIITKSADPRLRHEAFESGIRALLAAGQPAEALAFAQGELALQRPSDELWREMTRLALMADAPQLAARYARRLTGLKAPP
jgi:hypothetical protein